MSSGEQNVASFNLIKSKWKKLPFLCYMHCGAKEHAGYWLILLSLQQALAYIVELIFVLQHFPESLIHGYILKQR